MVQNKFEVVFIRKNIAYASVTLLMIQLFMVVTGIEYLPKMEYPWKIIFLTFYPSIMFYFMITRLLYRVKVEGYMIKVRTEFGRKYQFSCRDIEKVACFSDYHRKGGPAHDFRMEVTINGKRVDTYVYSNMTGFQTMAGYILEQYERGEIKPEAISKNCKKMLTKYKNMELKK